ncbi:hybrid sensor histidine kinase/response regulator [Desulfospira joergensenii]|uniref:hybrid sensor histidine kinase/response regulator n=1 Tax=Desulfospira joergensenii TaxID=53329 RepID=UPI0003FB3296|nr:response regulator [Desulfospira joergensenii]
MNDSDENGAGQIKELRERLKILASQKSRLQIVSDILTELASVRGLENMVKKAILTIMEAIGGANVIIYYLLNDDWYYSDINTSPTKISAMDDPLVSQALSSRSLVESDELTDRFDVKIKGFAGPIHSWVFPLSAGENLIGALKLDGIFIKYTDEIKKELQIIAGYIGLALGNQIVTDSKLKTAYDALKTESRKLEKEIAERKQAEETLRLSHERFVTVLDSIDATIYVADMETFEVLFMNQHMIKNFGRDLTGEKCWEAFRGETGKCSCCTNDELIDETGNPKGVCVWHDKNPITGKFYINHDRAIKWTDGRLVRLQIATDITEFRKMEEQLRQAQKMEAVGRLAGGVAHDFNNMLSIILGNTEMILEDAAPGSPSIENLREIKKAAERSSNLTRQLLAFARKQTIAPKVLDLNDAIEGMLNMLRRLIGEDILLAWLPGMNLWTVKVDPSQIDQILANLCVNSRDSIADVGKIIIETANITLDEDYCREHEGFRPGEYVMICVSDTGHGMEKETQKDIFEPFFTTKGDGRGTGLGLATVYGIVKQNEGFINVYSKTGQGTTFKIYLPRHGEKPFQAAETSREESHEMGEAAILLVEDEKAILTMTKMMLERQGYTVLGFSDPQEAVEIGRSHDRRIDLLITDVVMPKMNGRDLARQLQHLFPDLKCLFMSGYTADVIAHHGVLDEGMEFIQKPFSKKALIEKVRDVLDKESPLLNGP